MSYRLLTFPISEDTWSNWIERHHIPIVELQGGQNACAIAALYFSGLIEEGNAIIALYNQYLKGNPGVDSTVVEAGISLKTDNIFNMHVHQGETIQGTLLRLKELLPDNTATIILYRHSGQGPISSHVNILGKLNGSLVVYEPNLNQIFEGDDAAVQYYTSQGVISLYTLLEKPKKKLKTIMSDRSKKQDLRSRAMTDAGHSNTFMDVESEEEPENKDENRRGVKRMILKNSAEYGPEVRQKKFGGKGRKSKKKIQKKNKLRKSKKTKKRKGKKVKR